MRFRRKDGDSAWAMLNVSLIEDDSGIANIVEGTLIDITQRKVAEERVQSLACYDALTRLRIGSFCAIDPQKHSPLLGGRTAQLHFCSLISPR